MQKQEISRLKLPNGCTCSPISVTPKNWKQVKKITGPWRIHYRFYDPAEPMPKQVTLKNMNQHKDLAQRKESVEFLIENEIRMLEAGYNPFHKKVISASKNKYDIGTATFFIDALYRVLDRINIEKGTKKEIRNYIIPNVQKAAVHLDFHRLFISEVKRKHIIFILDHVREVSDHFTDNTFNHYRKYLRILFSELVQVEAIETNIIKDIPVRAVEKTQRKVLNEAERIFINKHLQEKYPEFHRFLHIFFHSGARISELLRLKGSGVKLDTQQFKAVVKKGRQQRTSWRPIKNIAMPFWTLAMEGCGDDDYVFSKGLLPGAVAIAPKQVTRRWYEHIKKQKFEIDGIETRITADFYSLKHLNTTEIVDRLDEQAAADLNAHTSTAMVVKIYDTKQKERKSDKIKKVNNPFA
jgi:integrase